MTYLIRDMVIKIFNLTYATEDDVLFKYRVPNVFTIVTTVRKYVDVNVNAVEGQRKEGAQGKCGLSLGLSYSLASCPLHH